MFGLWMNKSPKKENKILDVIAFYRYSLHSLGLTINEQHYVCKPLGGGRQLIYATWGRLKATYVFPPPTSPPSQPEAKAGRDWRELGEWHFPNGCHGGRRLYDFQNANAMNTQNQPNIRGTNIL